MRKLRNNELGRLSPEEYAKASKTPLVVVLDNIRSMHNVGSIFRTADCFLAEHIYLCGLTPQPGHHEIEKTALGATQTVSWSKEESILTCISKLKAQGYRIVALEQAEASIDLREYKVQGPTALVLGHEVMGVQQEVVTICDDIIEIKQFGTKHSLNVSVSAGMALFQIHKGLTD
ncbi:MAG: RNA methyltransferase [Flavobacteriales bacterium]|nr:RNA methyltransferase [Flavobacteriales bacterium]